MDIAKIIKVALKIMLKMTKNDWIAAGGVLGCLGTVLVFMFVLTIVSAIIGTVLSLILSLVGIETNPEIMNFLVAVFIIGGLFALHIYNAYQNGFYDKKTKTDIQK